MVLEEKNRKTKCIFINKIKSLKIVVFYKYSNAKKKHNRIFYTAHFFFIMRLCSIIFHSFPFTILKVDIEKSILTLLITLITYFTVKFRSKHFLTTHLFRRRLTSLHFIKFEFIGRITA